MIKDLLNKLFPPFLVDYIPGRKIVAGAVAYLVAGLTQGLGVDLSVIGLSSDEVQGLTALLVSYLWPTPNTAPVSLLNLVQALKRALRR